MDKKAMGLLKKYFVKRSDIAFTFLFGSSVRNKIRTDGDVDIAVYFAPQKGIEWEAFGKRYKEENHIALDLEMLFKKDVDLVVLNRASAIVADEILRKGVPILIRDTSIFLDFLCLISDEAEYARTNIIESYRERMVAAIG
ncbi:MAG: nucleotidyltransferase domain-containing protein [Deltaproteobacteria bacterium]|nr:nucleotidyltransferase domain-containing protein [Deltaproteobacteria bacterium]MCL5791438.1 nucleotidyltransferase domain-containing protein [Deltaproteobacteria bacterium]